MESFNPVINRDLTLFIDGSSLKDPAIVGIKINGIYLYMHRETGYLNVSKLFENYDFTYSKWYCCHSTSLIHALEKKYNTSADNLIFNYEGTNTAKYDGYYVHWDLICDAMNYVCVEQKMSVADDLFELYTSRVKACHTLEENDNIEKAIKDITGSIKESEKETASRIDKLIDLVEDLVAKAYGSDIDESGYGGNNSNDICESEGETEAKKENINATMIFFDNYYQYDPDNHGVEEIETDAEYTVIFCNSSNEHKRVVDHKKKYLYCSYIDYVKHRDLDLEEKWKNFVYENSNKYIKTSSNNPNSFSLGKYGFDIVVNEFRKYIALSIKETDKKTASKIDKLIDPAEEVDADDSNEESETKKENANTIVIFFDNYYEYDPSDDEEDESEADAEYAVVFCNSSNKHRKMADHAKKYPYCHNMHYVSHRDLDLGEKWKKFAYKTNNKYIKTSHDKPNTFSLGKYGFDIVADKFSKYVQGKCY